MSLHIDSSGLGTPVYALAKLRKARAHMELFSLTKLPLAFDLFADEQDAVNSFDPDREPKHFDILEFVRSRQGHGAD